MLNPDLKSIFSIASRFRLIVHFRKKVARRTEKTAQRSILDTTPLLTHEGPHTTWRYTLRGGTHFVVVHTTWWYTLRGGTHFVVVHSSWWYTLRGGTHYVVVHSSWWYTLRGGTHYVVVHTTWWYTIRGGTH